MHFGDYQIQQPFLESPLCLHILYERVKSFKIHNFVIVHPTMLIHIMKTTYQYKSTRANFNRILYVHE